MLLLLGLSVGSEAHAFVQAALDCGRLGKVTAELPECCQPTTHAEWTNDGYGCCDYLELSPGPSQEQTRDVLRVAGPALASQVALLPGPRQRPVLISNGWRPSYARPPPIPIPTAYTVLLL